MRGEKGHEAAASSPDRYRLLTWGWGSLFNSGRMEFRVSLVYSGWGWNREDIKAEPEGGLIWAIPASVGYPSTCNLGIHWAAVPPQQHVFA